MFNLVQTRCVRNAAKSSVAAHALSSSTIPIRFQGGSGGGDDDNFDDDMMMSMMINIHTIFQQYDSYQVPGCW